MTIFYLKTYKILHLIGQPLIGWTRFGKSPFGRFSSRLALHQVSMNDSISTSSEINPPKSFILYRPRRRVKVIQNLLKIQKPLLSLKSDPTSVYPPALLTVKSEKRSVVDLVIKSSPGAALVYQLCWRDGSEANSVGTKLNFLAPSLKHGGKTGRVVNSTKPVTSLFGLKNKLDKVEISSSEDSNATEKSLKTKKILDWVCYSQSQYSAKRNEESSPESQKPPSSINTSKISSVSFLPRTNSVGTQSSSTEHGRGLSALSLEPVERIISDTLFERQNILQCYKERNLLRLFIAFCDFQAKEVNERRARLLKGSVQEASESEKKVTFASEKNKNSRTESVGSNSSESLRAYIGKTISTKRSMNSWLRSSLAGTNFLGALQAKIQKFRQLSKQLFRESSVQILVQILIIPYTFIFGIFYTFTSFQLSSTLTAKDYSTTAIFRQSQTEPLSSGRTKLLPCFSSVAPAKLEEVEPAEIKSSYPLSLLYSYSIQFHSLPEEFLRLSHFSSKIFILWGFLNIWKGVRPAKSTRNEYVIQTRLLTNRKNKKRFSDVEGIEKFLPVLKTLVESFQANYSNLLPQFAPSFTFQPIGSTKPERARGDSFTSFGNLRVGKLLAALFSKKTLVASSSSNRILTHPKGYLFIGPPGTGKTLLAQAVAGEAKVNLICLSASEIQKQIDIGTRIGAIRLRNLFEQARKNTPCILFLDEIDAIGRARNESMDLKLFTEFLIQMDGFSIKNGFIVIGTTNFLSSLDSAFVRSGRFDRIIGLNYPGKQTRIDILKLYTNKQGFDPSISWNYFGEITKGFSAADLSKVVNESSLYLIETKFIATNLPNSLNDVSSFESIENPITPADSGVFRSSLISFAHATIRFFSFLKPKWAKDRLVHTSSSLERGIQRISNHN